MNNAQRRVVVTGLGAITPLGLTVRETWEALVEGRSGVGPITLFDASELPVRIAAEVKGFDPTNYVPPKEAKRMSRNAQFAVAAVKEALEDGGLPIPLPEVGRIGIAIGTGVGGMREAEYWHALYREKGLRSLKPYTILTMLPNLVSFYVAHLFGGQGPSVVVSTACAAGTQAIGEAVRFIREGLADVVIAGGTEAAIFEMSVCGFYAMRALSTRNDEPERASRPFDAGRDGFVMGEGCAILVLEEMEHALARNARIYAEVLGYGACTDAHHIAAPQPEGEAEAMKLALEDAGLTPDDVDYINAHGTATLIGDPIETQAIKLAFGERAYEVPISSTKSMTGHLLGAAGALEALIAVLTVYHGVIPPTINLETPDPQCDLDYVPNRARQAEVKVALSNSFGLGGLNACLVIGTPALRHLSASAPQYLGTSIIEAGGIVFWGDKVVLRRNPKGHWLFPKGHIEEGESLEEAAVREVAEELGLRVRIVDNAGIVRFSYQGDNYEVHFFVMEVEGPLENWPAHKDKDAFVLEVDEALERLSFPDYAALLKKCREKGLRR